MIEIKLLLKKVVSRLTASEEETFQNWINQSNLHKQFYENYLASGEAKDLHLSPADAWEKIQKKIHQNKLKNYRNRILRLSAVGIVLLGISQFFSNAPKNIPLIDYRTGHVQAGTDKAILTTAEGSNILLGKGRSYQAPSIQSLGESLVYQKNDPDSLKFNTLVVPRGGEFRLKLSDGSQLWLNSESSIRYPVSFSTAKPREVWLHYGEIYLEVVPQKHTQTPFIVHSKQQEVSVLGTKFNIRANRQSPLIKTTLEEGKVQVASGIQPPVLLAVGEQSQLDLKTKKMRVVQVNLENELSWRSGYFNFKELSLAKISQELSRWYNVDFHFKTPEIQKLELSGFFHRKEPLEVILAIIESTQQVSFTIEGDQIQVYR